MRIFTPAFLLVGFSFTTQIVNSQVVINELSSANDATITDEDGDYEDWIELYNPTNNTISLNKYSFLYQVPNESPVTWTFPKVYIKPKAHLLIFASKKDRKDVIDHWEVPVFADSIWRYRVNTINGPGANWYQPSFSDAAWLQGKGGFGYGDGDDQTITSASSKSVFLRKTFAVTDTSKYSLGVLLMDYDDAFVAFLNGVEVSRSNIGAYGDHPAYNVSAYDEHEAQLYQGGTQEFYFTQLQNVLKPGNNVLAIQAHNYSGGLDDLTVMPWLIMGSKDTAQQFISFPADFRMHTNFTLSSTEGFKLTMKDSLGNIKDSLTLGIKNMQANNSKGRNPDGSVNWCLFWGPSPADTNDVTQCFGTYTAKPAFNLPAGFYTGIQTLSITVPAGTTVFYTRNGDVPDWTDPMYTAPIPIDSTQVIRARAFDLSGTDLPSVTITNSYFINENITLPVISLCTDSVNLWDWNTGIYVMGPNADTALPYSNSNFWMPWKKQAHTEFFQKNKLLGFEQDCATEIHGNISRAWPQKSFRIMANDDYQDPYINYKLFPQKNITKFKSFNVRNAGVDWNTCHFRDRLMHEIVQGKTDIDIMDGEACVLFLNGQYWGVYEVRERQDENYIAENHNVSPDSLDLLRFEGDILEGSNTAFYDMVGFMFNNNMTIQANYDSAMKLIDVENYCDYFITETYYNNWDWIWTDMANKSQGTNNIKFWRNTNPVSSWRYVLWDTDLGLALFDGPSVNCPQNLFGSIIDPVITSPSLHVVMLKSLLKNTTFKNYFVNRYCDLMHTVFYPDSVKAKVQAVKNELLPEMARQFARWNQGPITIFGILDVGRAVDVPTWLNEIDTLEAFVDCRPYSVRDSLQMEFALTKQVDVTLDVSPPGAGKIHLNTIDPGPFPWTGVYMDGVPVTMTATANPGFKFKYWDSPTLIGTPITTNSVSINVNLNETFTAYFDTSTLGISENDFNYPVSVFPNPFSGNFTLNYSLPSEKNVSIKLMDITGREIAELVSSDQAESSGPHRVKIDAQSYSLTDGVYFINFTVDKHSKIVKLFKTSN